MNYINIFNIPIPSYSLMIIIGLIIANILAFIIIKKHKLIIEDFIIIQTYALAFGMLGAKILYLFIVRDNIDWHKFFDFNYIKPFIQGGFVFYGGLIGGLCGILLSKVIHKIDIKRYLPEIIFCLPLIHSFGRIGCYLSGCCYGVPYSGPFNVQYHNIPYTLCDIKLFPVQLIEALLLFLIALILLYLTLKRKSSFKILYFYLISYSIIRFILEFYRFDSQRGELWIFSTSQWISLILLIISIYMCFDKNKIHL